MCFFQAGTNADSLSDGVRVMNQFNPSEFHPKFVAAIEALDRIPEDQRHTSPLADDLMAQAMQYAPEYLRQMFREKMRELGLLPEPAFYTDDGEPMYTTEQVDFFG